MITRDGMNGISASAATPRSPRRQRLDVGGVDDAARVAEQVLEQDPDRDGQARLRDQRVDGSQAVDVRQTRAEGRPGAEGVG